MKEGFSIKQRLLSALCAAFILAGCANAESSGSAAPSNTPGLSSSSEAASGSATESVKREGIERPDIGAEVVIDPPYDFDPAAMTPQDFGDYFAEQYPVETETYTIGEGDIANEVLVMKGEQEGPTVYIVSGVHGDEIAGWMTGNLVKKVSIKAGELHILAPANRWGANAEPRTRYVTEKQDLNRSFPGNSDGTMAEQVANSIYQDVARVNPIFLFDLHEARANVENRDFLGSSLIYTSLDKMSDMYMELLLATESGELCSERFNFFGPGPIGSINNTVTTNLDIPTITVETYRGYPLERRIGDQLAIVEFVLTYYGLR